MAYEGSDAPSSIYITVVVNIIQLYQPGTILFYHQSPSVTNVASWL